MNINATLFGQAVALFLFVWFCMKFVWPPLTAALAERQKKIEEGLNAAEKAQRDLADAEAKVAEELKVAKVKAAELIEQANKRATQMVEEAKAQAAAEAARIKAQAQSEIDQEVNRAKDALRAELSALAVLGAEKILQAKVDASAHGAMLDQLAGQL